MPMGVELTTRAVKDLDALKRARPQVFQRVVNKIATLQESPEVGKRLVGPLKGMWSLRVGDYRIIYEVGKTVVVVLTVNHRKEVYR
ncbi:MAG: type II toxin-antitoxin system RelE/ParE family toxin [Ignavibacteriales bacterium]|nr:type II toxin-antitoxin system RelE/ParE family toxin [Ignavibacteriales bacterium]